MREDERDGLIPADRPWHVLALLALAIMAAASVLVIWGGK
jgi:hypothetical protein